MTAASRRWYYITDLTREEKLSRSGVLGVRRPETVLQIQANKQTLSGTEYLYTKLPGKPFVVDARSGVLAYRRQP